MRAIDVVLLAYNERETIQEEVSEINELLINKGWQPNLFVVEDGSKDGTSQLLTELSDRGILNHISSEKRRGYREALLSGLKASRSEIILCIDGGRKFIVSDLVNLLEVANDSDLVLGYRSIRSDSNLRKLFTYFYNLLIRLLFMKVKVRDADTGIRLYSRGALLEILKMRLLFPELVSSEITIRSIYAGLEVKEIPVSYRGRQGVSRALPPRKLLKVIPTSILRLIRLRTEI